MLLLEELRKKLASIMPWRLLVHDGAGLREECGEKYRGGAIEGEPYWSEVEGAGSADSGRLYFH